MATLLENFAEEITLRRKPFPLKYLLSLFVHSQVPFNDFLLLTQWLAPFESPQDSGAKYFQAFNTFEIQQIAASTHSSCFVVQQCLMELYQDDTRICN